MEGLQVPRLQSCKSRLGAPGNHKDREMLVYRDHTYAGKGIVLLTRQRQISLCDIDDEGVSAPRVERTLLSVYKKRSRPYMILISVINEEKEVETHANLT